MNNELSSILENYFNLSYEEELYFSLDILTNNYKLSLAIYIPQPGYYEKEYKKRNMKIINKNFSIVSINYRLEEGRLNPVNFVFDSKKVIAEDEFKIFPQGAEQKVLSKQMRINNAINNCIELVNRYLPAVNNANEINYDEPIKKQNWTGYPYFYSQIRFI